MDDFSYYLPVHLEFGCGKLDTIGELAVSYGKTVLIVSGCGGSAKRNGVLDRVMASLAIHQIDYILYDKVPPNPTVQLVEKGTEFAKRKNCQVIIGIGGGSVLDCAKAIAFSVCNAGDLIDYMRGRLIGNKALPVIAVPTTCGTGSECTPFAVLTDEETRMKRALDTNLILPAISLIDPGTMENLPLSILSEVAFDALCHHIESYLSNACQPLIETRALHAIAIWYNNLILTYPKLTKPNWQTLAFCSMVGGMNIAATGVTALHGLEHPVSGLTNVSHGRGLAILAYEVFKQTIEIIPEKFAVLSRLLGGVDETDFLIRLEEIIKLLGLVGTLHDIGVTQEDIPWLVKMAMRVSRGAVLSHPKIFSKQEIESIYLACL